jgi:hypothetical protein
MVLSLLVVFLVLPAAPMIADCTAACCKCRKVHPQDHEGYCDNASIGENGNTECSDPCPIPQSINCTPFASIIKYRPLPSGSPDYQVMQAAIPVVKAVEAAPAPTP